MARYGRDSVRGGGGVGGGGALVSRRGITVLCDAAGDAPEGRRIGKKESLAG